MGYNGYTNYDDMMALRSKSFPDVYEQAVRTIADRAGVDLPLMQELAAKRAFGLKKYGKKSFQSTFENAIAAPVVKHLEDELVDALNYAIHLTFVQTLTFETPKVPTAKAINSILDALAIVRSMRDGYESSSNS